MSKFDAINDSLDIEVVEEEETKVVEKESKSVEKTKKDSTRDYEYTRGNLYSLIEKGQEALDSIMEVAGDSASPRAFEVAGQIIKSVADTTDKLMDLQKKVKEVEEEKTKTTNNVTNNALFVGSTSELSKMLKQGILNNNDQDKKIKDD